MPFPDFSLLSITSFISFLNSIKGLQVSSIKGYLSSIQFFHKLMFGSPSPEISNSQTSMLIKGIQRSRPTRPDSRLPITLDILTKCIHTLRTNYQPPSTARTLDVMFILAFFGFLRCSELTTSSKFDPDINPTISDLSVLDSETISYLIKQSKTDQAKKGHFIYIFKLSSPIQATLERTSSTLKQPTKPSLDKGGKKKKKKKKKKKNFIQCICIYIYIYIYIYLVRAFQLSKLTFSSPTHGEAHPSNPWASISRWTMARASQLDNLPFPSCGRRALPILAVSIHLQSGDGKSLPAT